MAFSTRGYRAATGIALVAAALLASACATGPELPESVPQPTTPPPDSAFVTAHGSRLFADGQEFSFRAVNFSNAYTEVSHESAAGVHHTDADFTRVRKLGFNTVRFAFNGYWFERDRNSFLSWLDSNIEAARQQDIKLILDLHTPIGGCWLDPKSEDLDFSVWTDRSLQQRNIDLWQTLAERYRDDATVAAFGLLNEPVTTDNDGAQWETFANQLIAAIREVDSQHLIILDRLHGVRGRHGTQGVASRFVADDANVLYDSHFYDPVAFTHQGTTWRATQVGEGRVYPDPSALVPTGVHQVDSEDRIDSQSVEPGHTEWERYTSAWQVPEGKHLVAGAPQIAVHGALSGTVLFDDMHVYERDPQGNERLIMSDAIDAGTSAHWFDWQIKTAGSNLTALRVDSDGANDDSSLGLHLRGTGLNTIAGWSNPERWFRVKPDHAYRIEGAMRSENLRYISGGRSNRAGFEINFYKPDKDSDIPVFHGRDREYLEYVLQPMIDFAERNAVPVAVLETGLTGSAFGESGRGGELWLQDLLSILDQNTVGYGLWNYHGEDMGIYATHALDAVGKPNRPLIDALLRLQTGQTLSAAIAAD